MTAARLWYGVAIAGSALAVLVGCATSASMVQQPEPTPTSGVTSSQLDDYRQACANAASEATTQAQIDYPRTLSTRVDVPVTYQLAFDTNATKLPPSTYVQTGTATKFGTEVQVKCRLVARLTAEDNHVDITSPSTGEDEWIEESVNGAGLFQWTWSVTPHRPGTIHLDMDVKPVVLAASDQEDQTLDIGSQLSVHGNVVQDVAWWFERTSGALKLLGAAVIGLLTWLTLAKKKLVPLVGRKRIDAAATEPPAPTSPGTPASES